MPFDFPQMESKTRTDLLWTDVWRIVEQLRLMEEQQRQLEERLQQIEHGLEEETK